MVQTDDVSRAVLTGGYSDQWKDVALRAVLALWDLPSWGESCSLEGAAAALEPKVAAGSKFKGTATCSGGGWTKTCLLHGWIRLSHRIG